MRPHNLMITTTYFPIVTDSVRASASRYSPSILPKLYTTTRRRKMTIAGKDRSLFSLLGVIWGHQVRWLIWMPETDHGFFSICLAHIKLRCLCQGSVLTCSTSPDSGWRDFHQENRRLVLPLPTSSFSSFSFFSFHVCGNCWDSRCSPFARG